MLRLILRDGKSLNFVPGLFLAENGVCKTALKWSILAENGTKMHREKGRFSPETGHSGRFFGVFGGVHGVFAMGMRNV